MTRPGLIVLPPFSVARWSWFAGLSSSFARADHDAPRDAAALHALVHLADLGERVDIADHRADPAAGDQRQRILELRAGGAVHAQHRLVAQEQLGGVERYEIAGQLADEKPATVDAQAPARRVEQRRTDVVDHHVHAFARGKRTYPRGEILAARADDRGVRAEGFHHRGLVRRGRLGNHIRSREAGKLNRVHAQSTTGARDQHPVTDRHVADVTNAVEHGTDRTCSDRRLLIGNRGGNQRNIVLLDGDIFRIAADHAWFAEKPALRAKRLDPAPTETARTANVITLRGSDAVAALEAPDLGSDFLDYTGDLMPGNAWQLDTLLVRSIARHHVQKTHAACGTVNQDIARAGTRSFNVLEPQDADATGSPSH